MGPVEGLPAGVLSLHKFSLVVNPQSEEIAGVIDNVQRETRAAVRVMEEVLANIVGSVDQTSRLVTEAGAVEVTHEA